MDVDYDKMIAFTGGKDGSIFKNHIDDTNFTKIFQGDPKLMINCLKYDDINDRLWYGTPDSQFQCLNLANVKNSVSPDL